MALFPTEKHKIGIENQLSKNILEKILLEMELPNCFGLYGNWGSGKTSALFGIKELLEKKNNVKAVYFEPWKYEYGEDGDLMYALLNKIQNELKIDNKTWKKIKINALTILSGVTKAISIQVPGMNIKLPGLDEIEKDGKFWEEKILKEHEKWIDKTEEFKNDFEEAITEGLKKQNAEKLFIFIDDLDRCLPENTIKLIEAIKNFLSVNFTLFIIAIDHKIVSEMIEKKYDIHDGYGNEYLLKIIPYYFELPSIDLGEEIKNILNAHGISITESELSHSQEFFKEFIPEARAIKHYLHQIGIIRNLSKNITEAIDKEETTVHYILVALYLIKKFPKYFLSSTKKRDKIISGIGNNIRYAGKETLNDVESLDKDDLLQLHAIFQSRKDTQYGHIDPSILMRTMTLIRRIN